LATEKLPFLFVDFQSNLSYNKKSIKIEDNLKIPKIKTQDDTIKKIIEYANEHNIDFIDAICDYCFKHDLDVVTIGEQIRRIEAVKLKISSEARNLNLLKN
jgi:hypothetical protein